MRTCRLHEQKRHFQRDCHFRADQRLKEKICPRKVRGCDGRLYGSKLETERELYVELEMPDLSHKRPLLMMFWKGSRFFTTKEARIRIQKNFSKSNFFRRVGVNYGL